MSTGKPRPLLPGAWTRKIFDINHELAHVGARAMRRMIFDRFVWSGMARYDKTLGSYMCGLPAG